MIGDAMRIQRTPRSMPATFSPCIQTLGLRLYEERVIAVRVEPNLPLPPEFYQRQSLHPDTDAP